MVRNRVICLNGSLGSLKQLLQLISVSCFHFSGEEIKFIDYVLVYSSKLSDDTCDEIKKEKHESQIRIRHHFEAAMVEEGIEMKSDSYGNSVYMKLHVPFRRLCKEAERMRLEMPLEGVSEPGNATRAVEGVSESGNATRAVEGVSESGNATRAVEGVSEPKMPLEAVEGVREPKMSLEAVEGVREPKMPLEAVERVSESGIASRGGK